MTTAQSAQSSGEFFRFERTDCDLPYYRGTPVAISPVGWIVVLAAVALAFTLLMRTQLMFPHGWASFIPGITFVVIPLAALAAVAGSRAPFALFRPLRARDPLFMVGFFLLNAIVTIVLGNIVVAVFDAVANPAADRVATASAMDRVLFFAASAVQLLGEEIFTILPFLAFLAFLDRVMSRKAAICLAALGASIIFAAIHLPTYQWHVPQAMIGLIPIRIVLLIPFILTRNIWVSTGTHVLNDWAIFGFSAFAASAAAE